MTESTRLLIEDSGELPSYLETISRFPKKPRWTNPHFALFSLLNLFAGLAFLIFVLCRRILPLEELYFNPNIRPLFLLGASVPLLVIPICFVWMGLLTYCSRVVVHASYLLTSLVVSFFALLMLLSGYLLFGSICLVLTCFMLFRYFTIKPYLNFTALLLKHSSHVIDIYFGLFAISFLGCMAGFVSMGFTSINILSIIQLSIIETDQQLTHHNRPFYINIDQDITLDGRIAIPGIIYFLFLGIWVSQIIVNVLHVSVSWVVARHYFSAGLDQKISTFSSLTFATTKGFGAICFGSLLTGIAQTIRTLVDVLLGRSEKRTSPIQSCFRFMTVCILDLIESFLELLNSWSYVYVAIYGIDYIPASRKVLSLLKNTGLWPLHHSIYTNIVSNVFSVITALIPALFTFIIFSLGWYTPHPSMQDEKGYISALLVFFFTVYISKFYFFVISSGVSATIVCYAEEPDILIGLSPELHDVIYGEVEKQKFKDLSYYVL